MASFNVANRHALVKDGRGSALEADRDAHCGTDGERPVVSRNAVTGEGGDAGSTMVE